MILERHARVVVELMFDGTQMTLDASAIGGRPGRVIGGDYNVSRGRLTPRHRHFR